MLTPQLREGLRELASAHEITENEMAIRMLHQMMNPDKKPLEEADIHGR